MTQRKMKDLKIGKEKKMTRKVFKPDFWALKQFPFPLIPNHVFQPIRLRNTQQFWWGEIKALHVRTSHTFIQQIPSSSVRNWWKHIAWNLNQRSWLIPSAWWPYSDRHWRRSVVWPTPLHGGTARQASLKNPNQWNIWHTEWTKTISGKRGSLNNSQAAIRFTVDMTNGDVYDSRSCTYKSE